MFTLVLEKAEEPELPTFTGLPKKTREFQKNICGGLVIKSYPTLATPWTVDCQAPLSMGFSRQEYWSGLPCPPPGDLPDPGIELTSPVSPALQVDSLTSCLYEIELNNYLSRS